MVVILYFEPEDVSQHYSLIHVVNWWYSNLSCGHVAAIQCLKRKRLYEQQIEQLGNFQLRIHDQVCLLVYYIY